MNDRTKSKFLEIESVALQAQTGRIGVDAAVERIDELLTEICTGQEVCHASD
jgi:hypothetical protein